MVNLGDALTLRATATGAATLLAECVRLIEAAEARRGRFVVLADRIARRYAPTVHAAAALTFLWWWAVQGVPVGQALLTACAVLIITCPCALALAVPAVQVIATGSLFQRGILLKSATALERLAEVDTIVFDKTGTITEPLLTLRNPETIDPATIRRAASLAATSRHPLSRALVHAAGPVPPADSVHEIHGSGLACGDLRLGSAAFAGDPALPAIGPELWFAQPNQPPQRFTFDEQLRADAIPTLARLRAMGLDIHLLSGDRPEPVARAAQALGITQAKSAQTPAEKVAFVEALRAAGKRVLMVGDGLNDGPALAAASVSASPSTAADISQTVADIVFQGALLAPVADTIATARRARAVMRENIAFSIGYNALMLPLAVLGYVTPWLAAAAMSSSSLIVMLNSLRVRGSKP
jgi:Cu2+-exporting ATPase